MVDRASHGDRAATLPGARSAAPSFATPAPAASRRASAAGEQTLTVVTDADTAIPAGLCRDLPLILAPPDAPRLGAREEPRDLRAMQAPAALEPVAEACLAAAARGPVLYVASGDGYSAPADAAAQLRALMAARRPQAAFRAVDSGATLMGCGWQAVAAAVVARGPGATLEAAAAAAQRVGRRVSVLAMLEFPQFLDLHRELPDQLVGARALVRLSGAEVEVLERPGRRSAALAALCARAEAETAGEGRLRLAIQHGGVAPAAEALSRWALRTLDPDDVEVSVLTRHAATRIGPGSLTLAWYRVPE